jgi:lycopene cyclase-like protein
MLPSYHYSYLVGVGIFWIGWWVCFALAKSYRSQMRWGTLLAAPLAITSLLFVPQYWTPPSLFDLDQKIHVGIEDFLWAAAVGGMAAVAGEIFLKQKLREIRSRRRTRHLAPFVLLVIVFGALEFWHPNKTMDNTIIAFAVGALVLGYLRRDLIPLMISGLLSFAVLYFLLFLCVLALYPEFVKRYWNLPALMGIFLAGVPLEELLFAATGGAIFSVAYEYMYGYRLEQAGRI